MPWDLELSKQNFKKFAAAAFRERTLLEMFWFASKYDVEAFNAVLQELFGQSINLFPPRRPKRYS